jgi:hypothetical protein
VQDNKKAVEKSQKSENKLLDKLKSGLISSKKTPMQAVTVAMSKRKQSKKKNVKVE